MLGKDNTEEVEGEEVVNAKLDLRAVSRHNGHWPPIGTVLRKATREEWEAAIFAPENEDISVRSLNFMNGEVIISDDRSYLHERVRGEFTHHLEYCFHDFGLRHHLDNCGSFTGWG
jgi:hypothetical protein